MLIKFRIKVGFAVNPIGNFSCWIENYDYYAYSRRVIIVYRVPECLSLRWNWVPPPPPPLTSVSSPLDLKRGGNTPLG